MNVVDIAIVLILAITILGGWYRGFVSAALGVMATLLAWLIGVACIGPVSNMVKGNEELYNVMLYYTRAPSMWPSPTWSSRARRSAKCRSNSSTP